MSRQWIIVMFLFPLLTYGQMGRWAKDISLYWGPTYRLDNRYYNSFDISYENFHSSCTHASYKGFGIRVDDFKDNNYSLSLKFFRAIVRRPDLFMTPYVGFSPVVFEMAKHIGLNMKPEIGLRFNSGVFTRRQPVSISLNVSYGYDIPIIEEKAFVPGRHDLSAKIALSFNIYDIRYFLKDRKTMNTDTLQTSVVK